MQEHDDISHAYMLIGIRDQFEAHWRSDRRVDFQPYFDGVPESAHESLWLILLKVDVELRRKSGQEVLPTDYEQWGDLPLQMVTRLLALQDASKKNSSNDGSTIPASLPANGELTVDQVTESHSPLPLHDGARATIGPYKLMQQIGEGGMGSVWMADQEKPVRRRVALKLIKSGADNAEVIGRFEAERQALAMMNHPNIAKVLDAGTSESGQPFFVMELVKGIPITKYCDDNRLSINDRLRLFIPVCKAVQHAHQKGIIHRDLKPSNVLVTVDDTHAVPKVIDFGLAKAVDHTTKLTDKTLFTEFGRIIGTLQYMSPEQAEMNQLDVDTRTDVYSLGVMLYELLTGTTPIDKETLKQKQPLHLLEMIRRGETARPSNRIGLSEEKLAGISYHRKIAPAKLHHLLKGELDWIVMKALERERSRRYDSTGDLATDIVRYLENEPVSARPPSAGYLVQKFVGKHRKLVATGAGILVLLIASLVIISRLAFVADRARLNAERALIQKEEALQETRQTIDQYVETVRNLELLKEARFKPLIETLLKDALQHYERLVAKNAGDSSELDDLATVLVQIGDLSHRSGNIEKSIDAFRQARTIQQRLVKDHATVDEYQVDLADTDNRLGRILSEADKREEALQSHLRVLALHDGLRPDARASARMRNILANSHNGLGILHHESGQLKPAIESYEQAQQVLHQLVQDFPESANYQRDLANTYNNLALLFSETSRSETALEAHQQALEIREILTNKYPAVAEYRQALATSYNNLFGYYAARSQPAKALELLQQAVSVRDRLAKEFPTVDEYLAQLGSSYNSLGRFYRETGQSSLGLQSHQQALAIFERLTRESPKVAEFQAHLASSHNDIGLVFAETNRSDVALESYMEALRIRQQLVLANAEVPHYRNALAVVYNNLGNLYFQLERRDDARESYRQAIEIREDLVRDFDAFSEYKNALATSHYNLGYFINQAGEPVEAIASYERACAIQEELVETNPDNTSYRISLMGSYINLAGLRKNLKQFGTAQKLLDETVSTLADLTQRDPNHEMAREYLKNALVTRAELREAMSEHNKAVDDWERAIGLAQESQRQELQASLDRARERLVKQSGLPSANRVFNFLRSQLNSISGKDQLP